MLREATASLFLYRNAESAGDAIVYVYIHVGVPGVRARFFASRSIEEAIRREWVSIFTKLASIALAVAISGGTNDDFYNWKKKNNQPRDTRSSVFRLIPRYF